MIKSKPLLIFTSAIIFPLFLTAQLNHFIYLQTEGKQPFYAKLDKKVFSSSASGYLIIPKLKDGQYNISIGFPKSESSEQTYTCSIENKDAGYLIKNFGEKGWGLFNLQTLDVVMSGAKAGKPGIVKTEKTDDFSNMLSEVVNDPSIKQAEKPVVAQKEKSVASKQEDKTVISLASGPIIVKKQLISDKTGVQATYIDITDDNQDTITIFIPFDVTKSDDNLVPQLEEVKAVNESKPAGGKEDTIAKEEDKPQETNDETKTTEQARLEQKKLAVGENKKFLPIEMKAAPSKDAAVETSPTTIQMVNSDCKAIASEENFLKLRKKMASEDTDGAMIAVAQTAFKAKCYTTDQVKNLSFLFLNDAGKYRFFDVAYQFVSDSSNFRTLQSQLTDEYYISRFKAMVRH